MSNTSLKKAPRFIKMLNGRICEHFNFPKDKECTSWYIEKDTMEFGIGCCNTIEKVSSFFYGREFERVKEAEKLAKEIIQWLSNESDVKSARIDPDCNTRVLIKIKKRVFVRELFSKFFRAIGSFFMGIWKFCMYVPKHCVMCWFDNE